MKQISRLIFCLCSLILVILFSGCMNMVTPDKFYESQPAPEKGTAKPVQAQTTTRALTATAGRIVIRNETSYHVQFDVRAANDRWQAMRLLSGESKDYPANSSGKLLVRIYTKARDGSDRYIVHEKTLQSGQTYRIDRDEERGVYRIN